MKSFYYSWTAQSSAVDFPVAFAQEDEFVLENGRRIYDFICTSFQSNLGHSHALTKEMIAEQLRSMPIASPKATFELKARISDQLNSAVGFGDGRIFYTVSGAEAVENALKIARQMTRRTIVMARQNSYHGASLGALSVTGDWRNAPHLTYDEGTVRIPDHDEPDSLSNIEALMLKHGTDQIAAVILETIGGTNGMSVPSAEWLHGVQELCRKHSILFILDEVLVGFGRCGPMFAFQDYAGIQPDMICMSKGISAGYFPFGAVWTSQEISGHYDNEVLCCGLTNYGHPLGLAATGSVLSTLNQPEFLHSKRNLESSFATSLNELTERPVVEEVRIRGLMAAIFFNRSAPSWQAGFDAGLHFFSRNNFVILAPPYISTPERLRQAIQTFQTLLD